MGRRQAELGALAVSNIKRRGINFVNGVAGLALNVTASGSRSWVMRYTVAGRRRDKGLGGYPDVTLADAKVAARSGEVRGATWGEFDLDGKVWTIPADRMKAAKEHRVPLSRRALAIIADQKEHSFCEYVFPGPRKGSPTSGQQGSPPPAKGPSARSPEQPDSPRAAKSPPPGSPDYTGTPLSDMTLSAVLRRMGVAVARAAAGRPRNSVTTS